MVVVWAGMVVVHASVFSWSFFRMQLFPHSLSQRWCAVPGHGPGPCRAAFTELRGTAAPRTAYPVTGVRAGPRTRDPVGHNTDQVTPFWMVFSHCDTDSFLSLIDWQT